jgi:hypothetical protein
MATYMEYVEAVQFKKGHAAVMECLDLINRGGYMDNWIYTADAIKVGSDGYDGHQHYVKPGDWIVLGSDQILRVVPDKDFTQRYQALPESAPELPR